MLVVSLALDALFPEAVVWQKLLGDLCSFLLAWIGPATFLLGTGRPLRPLGWLVWGAMLVIQVGLALALWHRPLPIQLAASAMMLAAALAGIVVTRR